MLGSGGVSIGGGSGGGAAGVPVCPGDGPEPADAAAPAPPSTGVAWRSIDEAVTRPWLTAATVDPLVARCHSEATLVPAKSRTLKHAQGARQASSSRISPGQDRADAGRVADEAHGDDEHDARWRAWTGSAPA